MLLPKLGFDKRIVYYSLDILKFTPQLGQTVNLYENKTDTVPLTQGLVNSIQNGVLFVLTPHNYTGGLDRLNFALVRKPIAQSSSLFSNIPSRKYKTSLINFTFLGLVKYDRVVTVVKWCIYKGTVEIGNGVQYLKEVFNSLDIEQPDCESFIGSNPLTNKVSFSLKDLYLDDGEYTVKYRVLAHYVNLKEGQTVAVPTITTNEAILNFLISL